MSRRIRPKEPIAAPPKKSFINRHKGKILLGASTAAIGALKQAGYLQGVNPQTLIDQATRFDYNSFTQYAIQAARVILNLPEQVTQLNTAAQAHVLNLYHQLQSVPEAVNNAIQDAQLRNNNQLIAHLEARLAQFGAAVQAAATGGGASAAATVAATAAAAMHVVDTVDDIEMNLLGADRSMAPQNRKRAAAGDNFSTDVRMKDHSKEGSKRRK
jgi:hypothetical protein